MLKIKNLSFSYQQNNILEDISSKLKPGELSCILGSNGSGKTTLIKCLNGILSADQGEIKINQKLLKNMKRKEIARQVSLVPQEHSSIFSYQSLDVVAMGVTPYLSFGSQPQAGDYERAREIMASLDILKLADRNYNNLSGGERQLVLISRALMQDSDYMLLDEPTSHLDFKNQHLIMRELKKISKQNKAVVTALHDPNLALKYSDRVIIIKDGGILVEGETAAVMTAENLSLAYDSEIRINELGKQVEINFESVPTEIREVI